MGFQIVTQKKNPRRRLSKREKQFRVSSHRGNVLEKPAGGGRFVLSPFWVTFKNNKKEYLNLLKFGCRDWCSENGTHEPDVSNMFEN